MILEAFAEYLQAADPGMNSSDVLARWLWEKLSVPPETLVDKVLHCEIMFCRKEEITGSDETKAAKDEDPDNDVRRPLELVIPAPSQAECERISRGINPASDTSGESDQEASLDNSYVFCGTSKSGKRLLKSLRRYSQSYEHQKLARWLHQLKASDFEPKNSNKDA